MTLIDRINAASASARHWLQYTSVQLALLVGPLASYAVAYPNETQQALALVPEHYRPLVTFAVFTVIPIWARVRTQPGIKPKGDGQ